MAAARGIKIGFTFLPLSNNAETQKEL